MNSDIAAQGATITNVGAGRFKLRSVFIESNIAAAPAMFLQIFNKANAVPGTDTPQEIVFLPANTTPTGYMTKRAKFSGSNKSLLYDTGLSFAITTTYNGNTDVGAANRPKVRIDYDGSTLGGAI